MAWHSWGDAFQHYISKGCDHSDAAYRADEWRKRNPDKIMMTSDQAKHYERGRREGAEEMRERAAKVSDGKRLNAQNWKLAVKSWLCSDRDLASKASIYAFGGEVLGKDIARAIRNLPIADEEQEGEG